MSFHLIARPRNGWLALAELALLIALFVGVQFLIVVAAGLINPELFIEFADADAAGPNDVFIIALSIIAPFVAAWIAQRNPAGLVSVANRVRWDYVGVAAAVAVPVYGVLLVVDGISGGWTVTTSTLALVVAMVLVVPVQAATEEFVFRAAIPQIVGNWLRPAWVAYGAGVLPFVFLHIYNIIGLVDIFIFALCAAYLTWRSNGIEQAVVLHAASNTFVFITQALRPDLVVTTDISWGETALSAGLTVGVTAGIAWLTRAKLPGSSASATPAPALIQHGE